VNTNSKMFEKSSKSFTASQFGLDPVGKVGARNREFNSMRLEVTQIVSNSICKRSLSDKGFVQFISTIFCNHPSPTTPVNGYPMRKISKKRKISREKLTRQAVDVNIAGQLLIRVQQIAFHGCKIRIQSGEIVRTGQRIAASTTNRCDILLNT
jgi:hypothetical protein